MKRWMYTHTIFTQLVVFTLVISLILTLLITGFLFSRMESMVKRELLNSYDQMTSQYMKNLEDKLSQYRNSIEVIAGNSTILETLDNRKDNAYSKGERISGEISIQADARGWLCGDGTRRQRRTGPAGLLPDES